MTREATRPEIDRMMAIRLRAADEEMLRYLKGECILADLFDFLDNTDRLMSAFASYKPS